MQNFRRKHPFYFEREFWTHPILKNEINNRESEIANMDIEPQNVLWSLIVLGFSTGVCIGGILSMLCMERNPPPQTQNLQRLIYAQRDSLRSLRTDFNEFRNTHEKELMNILRETLRVSPRSIASDDEPNH